MKKDQLLEEFRKFELGGKDSTNDARKFILGGYDGSPETSCTKDGKSTLDDCENDTPPPKPIIAEL